MAGTVNAADKDFSTLTVASSSQATARGKSLNWKPNPSAEGFGLALYQRDAPTSPYRRSFVTQGHRMATYRASDAKNRHHSLHSHHKTSNDTNTGNGTSGHGHHHDTNGTSGHGHHHDNNTRNGTSGHGHHHGHRRLLYNSAQQMVADPSSGTYYVYTYLGTPRQRQTLIFDTGSSLTWAQCLCKTCQGSSTHFKIGKSSTYTPLKCNTGTCNNQDILGYVGRPLCRKSSTATCPYSILYGAGDIGSTGLMGSDTLTMIRTNGKLLPVKRFLWGCHFGSDYDFLGNYGNGILGAGTATISLPYQLKAKYNNIFSTCLVDYSSTANSRVIYGPAAVPKHKVRWTPLIPDSEFYNVQVLKVTVGGYKVSVPSSAWSSSNGFGGTILDTGTSLAYLDTQAWNPIFNMVLKHVSGVRQTYDYQYSDGTVFSPCWTHTTQHPSYPNIKFFLKGGPVIEVSADYYVMNAVDNVYCNVVGTIDGGNLFGALFLQNKIVVWDRLNNRIGFKGANCASP
eukprot:TRINITY_DN24224_c0_g1_i1.p1 TRINITY_DN24224_c0_g1~~TRINITY_DN24224_c0_g1_i1.p1  ORF type:complete len:524 (+),score=34.43 TRINITY_DN24224_c0_g1_i1:43-1572(+)